jgi:hypothetical protein
MIHLAEAAAVQSAATFTFEPDQQQEFYVGPPFRTMM